MGRIVAAIIFGYITIALLVIITTQIVSAIIPGFQTATTPHVYYFNLVINTLYAIVGGYLCSTVARASPRTAAIGLIILGEVLGMIAQARLWNHVPHWFGIALLVLYAVGVWIGSALSRRASLRRGSAAN